MRRIAELIDQQMEEHMAHHPFFEYLLTEDIPLIERLTRWIPSIATFAMGFKDVCNIHMKYPTEEAKEDPLKAAINDHCREDGTHWKWLMMDLKTLGINNSPDIVSVLTYLWGKDVEDARKSVYDLVILCNKAQHPLLRVCIIQSMESLGHALFKNCCKLGLEYEEETGKRLHYFGKTHLDHEEGHLMCNPGDSVLEDEAWKEELSDEMFQQATEIVKEVFRTNKARWNEYTRFISNKSNKRNIFTANNE